MPMKHKTLVTAEKGSSVKKPVVRAINIHKRLNDDPVEKNDKKVFNPWRSIILYHQGIVTIKVPIPMYINFAKPSLFLVEIYPTVTNAENNKKNNHSRWVNNVRDEKTIAPIKWGIYRSLFKLLRKKNSATREKKKPGDLATPPPIICHSYDLSVMAKKGRLIPSIFSRLFL